MHGLPQKEDLPRLDSLPSLPRTVPLSRIEGIMPLPAQSQTKTFDPMITGQMRPSTTRASQNLSEGRLKTARFTATAAFLALGFMTSCGGDAEQGAGPLKQLRVSGIPDADKASLAAKAKVLEDWLSGILGVPVIYEAANDYNAAVNMLAANKVDMSWLGGYTAVDSETRTDGHAEFVACRESDLTFKTYFIANKDAIAADKVGVIATLDALKETAKDVTFTFGSKKSTSGHLMPRWFLSEAGIDPETDFKEPAKNQDNHSATLRTVASGAVDMGTLNYKTWESADDALKADAPVVFTSDPYVDYCLVAHDRLGKDVIEKIRKAFVSLDASKPEDKSVLDAFSAAKFVAAKPSDWDQIRNVAKSLKEKGILQ